MVRTGGRGQSRSRCGTMHGVPGSGTTRDLTRDLSHDPCRDLTHVTNLRSGALR